MTLHGNVLHVWWCSLSLMMSLVRHICVSRWSPSPLAGADRLGGPRLRTPSCSWLCLIPATGKGAGHRVGGSQALISSSTELGGHTCSIVHQGSSLETRPSVYLAGHAGTLRLQVPEFQAPRGNRIFSMDRIVFTDGLGPWATLIGMVGTLPQLRFLEASRGPVLPAGPSQHSLRSAVWNSFLHTCDVT